MDITTLAAARAYTDKKVAEGGGSGCGLPVIHLSKKASFHLHGLVKGGTSEPMAEDVAEVAKLMGHEVGVALLLLDDTSVSLAFRVLEMQEGDMYICAYAFSGIEVNNNGALPVIVFGKGGEYGDGVVIVADKAVF